MGVGGKIYCFSGIVAPFMNLTILGPKCHCLPLFKAQPLQLFLPPKKAQLRGYLRDHMLNPH